MDAQGSRDQQQVPVSGVGDSGFIPLNGPPLNAHPVGKVLLG